jgi:hypothetical protein
LHNKIRRFLDKVKQLNASKLSVTLTENLQKAKDKLFDIAACRVALRRHFPVIQSKSVAMLRIAKKSTLSVSVPLIGGSHQKNDSICKTRDQKQGQGVTFKWVPG